MHQRIAAIGRQRLMAGIHHRHAGHRRAHHRRQHEERLPEGRRALVAGVIGIHEGVGAGLDFRIDAARRLLREGAGARAADNGAGQPLLAQLLHRAPRIANGAVNRRRPRFRRADMLGTALIGLDAAKDEMRAGGDILRQRHRIRPRPHAAARTADINFHQHRDAPATGLCRGGDGINLPPVIDADAHPGNAVQRRQPRQLARAHHLIGDQNIRDAAPGQHLGLGHFLYALAHRAALHLQPRDHRRLMGLGMRPQLGAGGGQGGGHGVQIGLEGIEVEQQGGGIHLLLVHAGFGGGWLHGESPDQSPSCGDVVHQSRCAGHRRWRRWY